nr:DUF421 domain-containing protein [Salsuginibacillus kocurii]
MTKWLGKTQITQLTPFDFISALVLGELVGNAIYDKEIGVNYVLYALALWTMLIATVEWVTQKFKKSRFLLEGEPTVIIRNGELDFQAMKKQRLDINQMQHLLRDNDVFSVREVAYGILEANGKLNIIKTNETKTPTASDLQVVSQTPPSLPITLIADGELLGDNIKEAGLTLTALNEELADLHIYSHEDVLFADWDPYDGLYVQPYDDKA